MKSLYSLLCLLIVIPPAFSEEWVETYLARLSTRDHYNSEGMALTSPVLILRQDRANFHKFRQRDDDDQADRFFQDAQHREQVEQFLEQGYLSPETQQAIVNDQPLVRVDVFRSQGHYAMSVEAIRTCCALTVPQMQALQTAALHYALNNSAVKLRVVVEEVNKDYAKVSVIPLEPNADEAIAYLKKVKGQWQGLGIGTGFDDQDFIELGIPQALWYETKPP